MAITAVWTAERVTDTDGYVGAVGPLADDEKVQDALIDRLEAHAADVIGLEQLPAAGQATARAATPDSSEGRRDQLVLPADLGGCQPPGPR